MPGFFDIGDRGGTIVTVARADQISSAVTTDPADAGC